MMLFWNSLTLFDLISNFNDDVTSWDQKGSTEVKKAKLRWILPATSCMSAAVSYDWPGGWASSGWTLSSVLRGAEIVMRRLQNPQNLMWDWIWFIFMVSRLTDTRCPFGCLVTDPLQSNVSDEVTLHVWVKILGRRVFIKFMNYFFF